MYTRINNKKMKHTIFKLFVHAIFLKNILILSSFFEWQLEIIIISSTCFSSIKFYFHLKAYHHQQQHLIPFQFNSRWVFNSKCFKGLEQRKLDKHKLQFNIYVILVRMLTIYAINKNCKQYLKLCGFYKQW